MKKILLYIAGVIMLASCGNDFLNVSPSNSAGAGDMIKNISDLKIATRGAYETLTSSEYYQGEYTFVGDLMGELLMEPTWGSRHLKYYYAYGLSKVNAEYGLFQVIYKGIHNINIILSQSKQLEDSEDKRVCIAELRVLRALMHLDVVKLYGPLYSNLGKGTIKQDALGVRIAQEPILDVRAPFYRDKVSAVYEFIQKELKEAGAVLPKERRNGYLNYWGARALLARVYLYMEMNGEAYNTAKEIIDHSGASLYTKDKYVDSWGREYAEESLFELATSFTDNSGYTSLGWICSEKGYKTVVPTADFIKLKDENPDDIRFALWQYSVKDKCYYISGKYPGRDDNIKVNNPKVIRLSEVYLIAAEAALKNNDTPGAGKYLSDLRENRTAKEPRKYETAVTLDDILFERALELYGEGHRAWDMWRNRKEVVRYRTPEEKDAKKHSDNLTDGVIRFDFYQTIYPISERELNLLPVADREKQQNPGY